MKGLLLSVTATLLLINGALCQKETNGTENSTRHPDDNLIASSSTKPPSGILLPEPVDVTHSLGVSQTGGASIPRVEIDHDGIPIIHGVVVPDDPNDKQVWRNARVLNNVLIENKDTNSAAVQDHGDMFVYRPQGARILQHNDGEEPSFKPSQADTFAPSLPYPAFYYQRYYQDKDTNENQKLPDNVAVETSDDVSPSSADDTADTTDATVADEQQQDDQTDMAIEGQTAGRGFNTKRPKKTGFSKQTPGSSIGNGARPISYYVQPEEAKAIHDDRSPYDYEPAQQQTSYYTNDYSPQQQYDSASKQDYHASDYQYYSQQPQAQQYAAQQQQYAPQQQQTPQRTGLYQQNSFLPGGSNVVPAPSDAFVIREQTYTSGGQTFSVPIPVPKDQYTQQLQYGQYTQYPQYQYQYPAGQQQQSYYQTAGQQPFDFLGAKLKEQVQKAKDKFHDMTDPVVDPLMEAGQKISTNLGLPERVHKINEKVATPSVLVPLAMAGGAALALGGLSTAIALSNTNATTAFKNLPGLKNSPLVDRLSTLKIKVKRSADDEDVDQYDEESENLLDRVMSSLNGPQRIFLAQLQRTGFDQWQKTPCAKRIFCDVMIQQSDDAIALMEKRMGTFLTM